MMKTYFLARNLMCKIKEKKTILFLKKDDERQITQHTTLCTKKVQYNFDNIKEMVSSSLNTSDMYHVSFVKICW